MLATIVIVYIGSNQFLPGGHTQFQMWYAELMPITILLSGLPALCSFNLYHWVIPIDINTPSLHQLTNMALLLWFVVSFSPENNFGWSELFQGKFKIVPAPDLRRQRRNKKEGEKVKASQASEKVKGE